MSDRALRSELKSAHVVDEVIYTGSAMGVDEPFPKGKVIKKMLKMRPHSKRNQSRSHRSSKPPFRRGLDYLGLKVKAKWLQRLRNVQRGFERLKTIECRAYPPKPDLRPGDTFYLLCNGEIWAVALLAEVRVYKNQTDFERDVADHHVAQDTCEASGSTSYASFTGAFSRGRRAIFGYVMSDVRFLEPRPKSGQGCTVDGRAVLVPEFTGQRYGQCFATILFPRLHVAQDLASGPRLHAQLQAS